MPTEIWTERLVGRPAGRDDWPLVHRLQTDPDTGPMLRGPLIEASEARSRRIAEGFAESWLSDGFGPYIWRRGARDVGYAGLRRSRLEQIDEVEALWAFLPEAQGAGLATEAARAAIASDGPRRPQEGSVASWTLPSNTRSIALMRRLGFHYERDADWAALRHVVYRWRPPARPAP